jgi:HPt (histidine-containing phosphotransfer) domain-containing protein
MGRPRGNWSDKRFREALSIAVNEEGPDGVKRLRTMAVKLAEAAASGDLQAIEMVANRLDGKPAQDINVESSVTHELASLTDRELADRIQRELAAIAGRGGTPKDQGKLH